MLVTIKNDYNEMSAEAARFIAERIRKKPTLVLGLATGNSPVGLYKELVRMHQNENLDFSRVRTFNLDEYIGLPAEHSQSYHHFMHENLFKHLNMNPHHIHIPDGMAKNIEEHCEWYERQIEKAGGIDVQVLGIGANAHLAFNEPGSSLGSRTRIKTLTRQTIKDNSRFFKTPEEVPQYAITMGIGTIMEARELLLLASGKKKAKAVKSAVQGPITAMCPASILQMHRKAYVLIDRPAAGLLSDTQTFG
ncbi:MAG TPA: glucosamine-6-phosphate deaminase [Bacteroidota bacterium]